MKEHFKVAQNVFSITAPDNLSVRDAMMRRYGPFVCAMNEVPVLDIEIKEGTLPGSKGEIIYEPEFDGIGFITSRASRLGDSSLVMEFAHVSEGEKSRLWMRMAASMCRTEIIFAPKSPDEDIYFVTHAIMIAYMLATIGNGTLLIHASTVANAGKAYLFQGKSGTGKSTHSRLWVENIAGAELLNDDHPVIRFGADGTAMAYGSPWSGKTHCYRNMGAEVGAFVRVVRGQENVLRHLEPLNSYASLTTSVFYLPILNVEQREMRHRTIERLACEVPCFEMHCRPDAQAALTCMKGVSNYKTTKIK